MLVKGSRGMKLERVVEALTGPGGRRGALDALPALRVAEGHRRGSLPELPPLPVLPHRRGGRRRAGARDAHRPAAHRAAAASAARAVSNVREDTPEHAPEEEGHADDGRGAHPPLHRGRRRCCLRRPHRRGWCGCALLLTFGYGFIGFLDDWLKLSKRNSKGLAGRKKMVLQTVFFLVAVFAFLCDWKHPDGHLPARCCSTPGSRCRSSPPTASTRTWAGSTCPSAGWWWSGTSNAVNLTDGLDGLAIVPDHRRGDHLRHPLLRRRHHAAVADIGTSTARASWSACRLDIPRHSRRCPAAPSWRCSARRSSARASPSSGSTPTRPSVFMGDVGSLALGGALGGLAVLSKNEVVSAIINGVFLVEIALGDDPGGRRSSAPASASSRWRPSTTTSSSRAWPSRRSSSASGSSRSSSAAWRSLSLKLR